MLFTLYVSGNGAAMVHELNLAKPQARCIDLPGTGDFGAGVVVGDGALARRHARCGRSAPATAAWSRSTSAHAR